LPIDQESVAPFTFDIPWFGGHVSLPPALVNWAIPIAGIGGLLVLLAAAAWWWQQHMNSLNDIFKLYRRMVQLAGWMGVPFHPWQTPFEHAALLQRRVPARQHEVETIATHYVYQTFRPLSEAAAGMAPPTLPGQSHNQPATRVRRKGGLVYESNLAWSKLRPEMLKAALKENLLHLPRRLGR
jgi:hypothetical protein